jgi:hypothetical protein
VTAFASDPYSLIMFTAAFAYAPAAFALPAEVSAAFCVFDAFDDFDALDVFGGARS